ncbi:hypothetical protein SPRG_07461 [Saprolegnia parasitica CBS 223.65]|uniref:Calcineurin-like phosphoesterase domain-containing protein n=1 Tax=Saprolegnia parasitica (strain CBS 223.65) TaxID=695850 RepID=A0A067CKC4_SAPPC|nr:hypothetical protein SPRG_07461 [Saprolegnia parasitica CBS 223.65]KDO27212.1 hypothetical protein SPRG_07461 [Saprolegnia parasitica CBS 223.65]|eukprot:XP_012201990.1 hypothetical protein SPRG_07461 [Saprolegnia parasitica CBS 223.65]
MPDALHVLVVADIRNAIARVNDLCDYVIRHRSVDVVLVCGSFVAPAGLQSPEELAAAEGDMTALISRLEMIVCRVVYVPGPYDPSSTKRPTTKPFLPKLTPYSINCDGAPTVLLPETDGGRTSLSELVVEGWSSAIDGHVAMELRTKYAIDESQCSVYRKLARLPWCCRIGLSERSLGSVDWIEKGQVLLRPGWFSSGSFALVEFGPRTLGADTEDEEEDEEPAWDVKACEVFHLDDEFQG